MEVVVFDFSVLAMKTTWLMRESITCPVHWMLMKTWLVVCFFSFCIFNNSTNIKPVIHCSTQNEVELPAALLDDIIWLKQSCLKCLFFFLFVSLSSLVFLLWWVNARSKRSLSSDIACQSRPEKCSLKVTLLWCLHSVCHYTFHFLWAKIYNVSFDRRSKHL